MDIYNRFFEFLATNKGMGEKNEILQEDKNYSDDDLAQCFYSTRSTNSSNVSYVSDSVTEIDEHWTHFIKMLGKLD